MREKVALAALVSKEREDNARLRAALQDALAMVSDFASGSGMSCSGQAEFDRLTALGKDTTA